MPAARLHAGLVWRTVQQLARVRAFARILFGAVVGREAFSVRLTIPLRFHSLRSWFWLPPPHCRAFLGVAADGITRPGFLLGLSGSYPAAGQCYPSQHQGDADQHDSSHALVEDRRTRPGLRHRGRARGSPARRLRQHRPRTGLM